MYINTSPASPAPEKCINTSPAVYINTSPTVYINTKIRRRVIEGGRGGYGFGN